MVLSMALGMFGCGNGQAAALGFDSTEYSIYSGDSVTARTTLKEPIEYRLAGEAPDGVTVDKDSGVITFGSDLLNGTQILIRAFCGALETLPVVVKLNQPSVKPEISITNVSEYLLDGDAVYASSKPVYAVTYSLKEGVAGISIDRYTGVVRIDSSVVDGTPFGVVITSNGYDSDVKTFKAKTADFVRVEESVRLTETGSKAPVTFRFDFSQNPEAKFISVADSAGSIPQKYYSYDESSCEVTISAEYLGTLSVGETGLSLLTSAHSVGVTIKKADMLVSTAEELASINDSPEALSKYYIQANDIDLGGYLNGNVKGWYPIGTYQDVTGPEATANAFAGTYDGNGHTITGGYMKRETAEAYNSGLFGYVVSASVIKNLGYEGGLHDVRSYSGTLVGVNDGLVSNCYSTASVRAVLNDPSAVLRVVGGFVGRNNGTIVNCFSTGTVEGDSAYGAFAGENNGKIENCFASKECSADAQIPFVGQGTKASDSCILFESLDAMKAYDFAFGEGWAQEEGQLPQLVSCDAGGYVRRIILKKQGNGADADYFTRGDSFKIEFTTSPAEGLAEDEQFTYSSEGRGVVIDEEGNVSLTNARGEEFTVIVSSRYAQGEMTYKLYEKEQGVEIVQPDTELLAGRKYRIVADVLPAEANQTGIRYELTEAPAGVTISGDVISVAEDADDGAQVKYRAYKNSVYSEEITAVVKGTIPLEGADLFFSSEAVEDAVFAFDQGAVKRVLQAGKSVPFSQSGDSIIIPASELARFGGGSVMFVFETEQASYRASVTVADKVIRTADDLLAINESAETLSKYYILGNDIDLQGAEIYAIGRYEETDMSQAFTGTFDGAGFTIRNFTVRSAKDGSTYNVGFFGYLRGKVMRLNLENGAVSGYNFVGGFVGSASSKATVSDCTYTGTVTNLNPNPGATAFGRFVGKNGGVISNCGASAMDGLSFCGKIENAGTVTGDYVID